MATIGSSSPSTSLQKSADEAAPIFGSSSYRLNEMVFIQSEENLEVTDIYPVNGIGSVSAVPCEDEIMSTANEVIENDVEMMPSQSLPAADMITLGDSDEEVRPVIEIGDDEVSPVIEFGDDDARPVMPITDREVCPVVELPDGTRQVTCSKIWVPPQSDDIIYGEGDGEPIPSTSALKTKNTPAKRTNKKASVAKSAPKVPTKKERRNINQVVSKARKSTVFKKLGKRMTLMKRAILRQAFTLAKTKNALFMVGDGVTQDAALESYNDQEPPTSFNLDLFCERTGSHPAEHRLMFFNQKSANASVSEAVFVKGAVVKTMRNDEEVTAKVRHVNKSELLLTVDDKEIFTTKVWDVTIEDLPSESWAKYTMCSLHDLVGHAVSRENCEKPVHWFVKNGFFFELIDETNPAMVHTVSVVENKNGFLKAVNCKGNVFKVHMADVHCKPIGFAEHYPNDFVKVQDTIIPVGAGVVPPFCFDVDGFGQVFGPKGAGAYLSQPLILTRHQFELGHLLSVVDPVSRLRIVPAFVSRIVNNFFFQITLIEDLTTDEETWTTEIVWASHERVFPFLHGNRDRCGTSLPKGLNTFESMTFEELNTHVRIDLSLPPLSRFPLPINEAMTSMNWDENGDDEQQKCSVQRNLVEIRDTERSNVAHLARVVRITGHFIVVSRESDEKFTPPKMYRLFDTTLLPLGTAKLCGWKLELPAVENKMFVANQLVEKRFTNNPLEVTSERTFLPSYFMKSEDFCPNVYVNRCCFRGPFIAQNRLWRLANVYGNGPIEKAVVDLISDLSTCCVRSRIMNFLDARKLTNVIEQRAKFYQASDSKDRQHSGNCVLFTFVACTDSTLLHYWLNILCRTIDACPGFLSLTPRDPTKPCLYGCEHANTTFASVIQPTVHVNTAYYNFVNAERSRLKRIIRKRKTIVEQLMEITPKRARIGYSRQKFGDFDDEMRESSLEMEIDQIDVDAPRQLRSRSARNVQPIPTLRPRITRRAPSTRQVDSSEDLSQEDDDEHEPLPAVENDSDDGVLSDPESTPSRGASRPRRGAARRAASTDPLESDRASSETADSRSSSVEPGASPPKTTIRYRRYLLRRDEGLLSMRTNGAKIRLPIHEINKAAAVAAAQSAQASPTGTPAVRAVCLPTPPRGAVPTQRFIQNFVTPRVTNATPRVVVRRPVAPAGGPRLVMPSPATGPRPTMPTPGTGARPMMAGERPAMGAPIRLQRPAMCTPVMMQRPGMRMPATVPRPMMPTSNAVSRPLTRQMLAAPGSIPRPIMTSSAIVPQPVMPPTSAPHPPTTAPVLAAERRPDGQISYTRISSSGMGNQMRREQRQAYFANPTTATTTATVPSPPVRSTTPAPPILQPEVMVPAPSARPPMAPVAPPPLTPFVMYDKASNRYSTTMSFRDMQTSGSATITTAPTTQREQPRSTAPVTPREQPRSTAIPPQSAPTPITVPHQLTRDELRQFSLTRNLTANRRPLQSQTNVPQQSLQPSPSLPVAPVSQADLIRRVPLPLSRAPQVSTSHAPPPPRPLSSTRAPVPIQVPNRSQRPLQHNIPNNSTVVTPTTTKPPTVSRSIEQIGDLTVSKIPITPLPAHLIEIVNSEVKNLTTDCRTWTAKQLSEFLKKLFDEPRACEAILLSNITGKNFVEVRDPSFFVGYGVRLGPALKFVNLAIELSKAAVAKYGH